MNRSRIGLWACAFVMALSLAAFPAGRAAAKPESGLEAAFVRDGDLWVKKADGKERQLTQGDRVERPLWSYDGEWIAYQVAAGARQTLKLLHVPTGVVREIASGGWITAQWAPEKNDLAYAVEGKLSWLRADKPKAAPSEIAKDISGFSWLPDGRGWIASTQSKKLNETDWTPVRIVRYSKAGTPPKTLRELPKPSDGFFAVGTSAFKFSPTGKWVAFLATPTASLSADGNALCLMSADGGAFSKAADMLNDEEWFQWAAKGERLAYIEGVGREATSNKRLMLLNSPDGKPIRLTPEGYVDQGFAWQGPDRVVVARAVERKDGIGSSAYPPSRLIELKLQGNRVRPFPFPPEGYSDTDPQYFPRAGRLAWIRTNRSQADVLVSGRSGNGSATWIANLDPVADYYGRWNWEFVLAIRS
ncbi:hypothetical protein ACFPPD_20300 [Cohnella suwonensis]|uniref:Translocation protein TolB n=1 Tax=Cohnella suwonensis TaxID=696072 RepID=A0ABW0LYY4_9BACL